MGRHSSRCVRIQDELGMPHRPRTPVETDAETVSTGGSPGSSSHPTGGVGSRLTIDLDATHDPFSPPSRRRSIRATAYLPGEHDADAFHFDASLTERPGWQPGSEPGFDPNLPDGGHASMTVPSAPCEITVVDFSRDRMVKRNFDNAAFISFLALPKEGWAKCRWININGLSWDVIQAVGAQKGLHRLALEDIMNTGNRTKADWYSNHAFIIVTLLKLVHLVDDDDAAANTSSNVIPKSEARVRALIQNFARGRKVMGHMNDLEMRDPPRKGAGAGEGEGEPGEDVSSRNAPAMTLLRTLQQYHASGNEARTEFMEEHSSLAPYDLAISAEQVSIFLTSDNTVISFFEMSAGDVERPIITRLSNPGTILRESCDASLIVQAIIDAIIDLAIPLTAVYNEVLGDLELDVLTKPHVKQCKALYICISEINKMLRFLAPIDNLVNVLRDHKSPLSQDRAIKELENPASGVIVTPMTHTYLGDVLDHCIIITEALAQQKQSAENLINLIFNTISATQNESMKQLTIVTIIFLPLTFITGFFGQNFPEEGFPDVRHGIWYFWACAVPTASATIIILMREMIANWFLDSFPLQMRHWLCARRKKKRKMQKKKPWRVSSRFNKE